MARKLTVAAAQLGPIVHDESRASAVGRLCAMMREAHAAGAEMVVFPELALTTFFPRWYLEDPSEIDRYFETEMPNAAVLRRCGRICLYILFSHLSHCFMMI